MKKLSDYKDGDEYEYDGCRYDGATALICDGLFGFCGCGQPDECVEYIYKALTLIESKEQRPSHSNEGAWNAWWSEYKKKELVVHGNLSAAYFFYYCADKSGFTEHGGSVPGWLSEKGQEMLALLKEWEVLDE